MSIKENILDVCKSLIFNRIDSIQTAIIDAQSSANNETKSTAGDKHDTSRAMMHLEVEKLSKQLSLAQNQIRLIQSIDPKKNCNNAVAGALVKTDNGTFYLATGIGKIELSGESIMVVSPASPIGQLLLNHQVNDVVTFNSINYKIEEIS